MAGIALGVDRIPEGFFRGMMEGPVNKPSVTVNPSSIMDVEGSPMHDPSPPIQGPSNLQPMPMETCSSDDDFQISGVGIFVLPKYQTSDFNDFID